MSINAEIIAIGNEIISGDVVDTNSSMIAKNLLGLGIEALWHTSVGDLPQDVKKAVNTALGRSELILITGGLGPTDDDLSVEIIAEALGRNLVFVEEIWQNIQETLIKGGRIVDSYNKKQAYIPDGATYFLNGSGTAPCVIIEEKGCKIFMMPGVPSEVKYFLQSHILPQLKASSDTAIKVKKIKLSGIAEASVNEIIKDIVLKDTHSIAFLPKSSELEVKITAKAKDEYSASKIVDEVKSEIVFRLKDFVFGFDDESVEKILHDILVEKNQTVSIAESCTGGLVSKLLTDTSGSSQYISLNLVTYSNEAKIKMLNVRKQTLDSFGAVSEETAQEMALGIRNLSGSDFGLSITGIAGPTGGTPDKPVGLVYVGLTDGQTTQIHKLVFPEKLPREEIRLRAAKKSLHLLKNFISKL